MQILQKKHYKKKCIMLMLSLITCCFVIPMIVLGRDNIAYFNDIFSTGEITINTDEEINDDSSLYLIVSRTISTYSKSEYYNSSSDYSTLNINTASCDFEKKECNFILKRDKAENNSYSSENINTYNNIKIKINSDVMKYFTKYVKNDYLVINYDESMFQTNEEKSNYILSYLNSQQTYVDGNNVSYSYDDYNKILKYTVYNNDTTLLIATKKILDTKFEYEETEFSDDFKVLTDGNLTIKSDVKINRAILENYLMSFSGNNHFNVDGKIVDDKVFIEMYSFVDGQSVVKEKHRVILYNNSNIDLNLFNTFDLGNSLKIKADTPTDKNSFINTYSNYYSAYILNYKRLDSNYNMFNDYFADDNDGVYVSFAYNNDQSNKQYHKIPVSYIGYSDTMSDEYQKNIGEKLTINSDVKDINTINSSIGYNYTVLQCNDDYSICDIGYADQENKLVEIHKVKIVFDNTISNEFKQGFNLTNDGLINIYTDEGIDISNNYFSYYHYDNNTMNTYSYSCNNNICTLKLDNYKINKHETHTIDYNLIVARPTTYFTSNVIMSKDIYPGETTNIWNKLNYSYIFDKNNQYSATANNCNKDSKTCEVTLLNENKNLEIHKVNVNIKNGKSPKFEELFPGDNISLNSIYSDNQDYIFKASMAYLMSKTKSWSYMENLNDGKVKVNYDNLESHTFNISFKEKNDEHKKVIDDIINKIDNSTLDIKITDLEFLNSFYYKKEGVNFSGNFNSTEFNNKLSKLINNKHVGYFYVPEGGGGNYYSSGDAGDLVLYYDGIAYGTTSSIIQTNMYNVLYVPNDTEDNIDSYIKAAQERVDNYLGKNSGVIISYDGPVETNELQDLNIDLSNHDGNGYKITFGNKTSGLLIIKDSSKMLKSTFTAIDVNNNVTVKSDNANYPTNTIVSSSILNKSNNKYSQLLEKYNLDNAQIIDIDLYSTNLGDIKNFNGTNFDVSIPLNNSDLKNKKLYAYYVDDDGNVEKHPINVDEFIANFETTHFSTYIIAEELNNKVVNNLANDIDKITNPKTFDGISLYIIMGIISLLGLITMIIYNKKNIIKGQR